MKYLISLKKRNSSTIWFVFLNEDNYIVARKNNSTEFKHIKDCPKFVREYVQQHAPKERKHHLTITL